MTIFLIVAACQPAATLVPHTIEATATTIGITPTLSSNPTPAAPAVDSTATSAPVIKVAPQALKGTHLIFWHPWVGAEADAVREMVNDFNQTNLWGIEAEALGQGSSQGLYENIQKALQGGKPVPRVIVAESDQIAALNTFQKNILDLSPYVSDPQWGFSGDEVKDFIPAFWTQDVAQNSRLGIPALRNAPILFYNETWAKELGFPDPPLAPSDFRAQACAAGEANMKDNDKQNDGTGGWYVNTERLTMFSLLTAFNDREPSPNEDGSITFNSLSNRGAFLYLRTLYDHNCAWTGRSASPFEYFASRRALFYSGTLQDIPNQAHFQKLLKSSDEWTILPYASKDGKPFILGNGFSYAVMSSNPTEQLASWLLVRWLSLSRHQVKLATADGSLPVSSSAADEIKKINQEYPQAEKTLDLIHLAKPAPSFANWRVVGPILEDAGWQLFQPNLPLEKVSDVLIQLDGTIKVVLANSK